MQGYKCGDQYYKCLTLENKFATDRGGTKEGGNGEKQVHVEGLSQWKWRERKEVAGYMS